MVALLSYLAGVTCLVQGQIELAMPLRSLKERRPNFDASRALETLVFVVRKCDRTRPFLRRMF